MVLWVLILGAVWPAASYVLTGWDCANPTHVTSFNKDKLCEEGPSYLDQEPLAFQLNHPLFFTVDMVGGAGQQPIGGGL